VDERGRAAAVEVDRLAGAEPDRQFAASSTSVSPASRPVRRPSARATWVDPPRGKKKSPDTTRAPRPRTGSARRGRQTPPARLAARFPGHTYTHTARCSSRKSVSDRSHLPRRR